MTIRLEPPPKPDHLTRVMDFVSRAIRGQLHLPPWWLRDVGGADFEAVGQEFVALFKELADLQPDEQVLDVGCGSGRIALPLTDYLNSEGSYVGMDIVKDSILWCQHHISARYPNFQFLHADLYNKRYNPEARQRDEAYQFPFEPNSFDFVFLTSVFTHMLPQGVENYLHQLARVLRPAGRGLVTFFLLNETQQTLAAQGLNEIDFKYGSGTYRMRSDAVPESAIAYEESFLRQLLHACGLEIIPPIHYGTWSGRTDGLSYQDIVLVRPRR